MRKLSLINLLILLSLGINHQAFAWWHHHGWGRVVVIEPSYPVYPNYSYPYPYPPVYPPDPFYNDAPYYAPSPYYAPPPYPDYATHTPFPRWHKRVCVTYMSGRVVCHYW